MSARSQSQRVRTAVTLIEHVLEEPNISPFIVRLLEELIANINRRLAKDK